jgi:DNA-binding NtrC family response regulator
MIWLPGRTLAQIERQAIVEALEHFDQNRTHAAQALAISIRTMRNKIREYRIEDEWAPAKRMIADGEI